MQNEILKALKECNILFVEDDENLVLTFELIFTKYFKSVTIANNGVEGLEKFEQNSIDIVLFFTILDNINGWVDNIFISKTAVDVHYMDASFVNDTLSIEALFGGEEAEEDMIFF